MNEWLTGTLCKRCKGRGELYPTDGPVKTCHVCQGARTVTPTDQTRSRSVGVSTKWWADNKIGDRIMSQRDELTIKENGALWHIYQKAIGARAA